MEVNCFALGHVHTHPLRIRQSITQFLQAKVYEEEKNYEKAFFLYCKYTTLFVECLPRHPQYKNADTANERRAVKTKLKKIFDAAETTKKVLLITFEEQHNQYLEDERVRVRCSNHRVFLNLYFASVTILFDLCSEFMLLFIVNYFRWQRKPGLGKKKKIELKRIRLEFNCFASKL